jgi:hypothetical protein
MNGKRLLEKLESVGEIHTTFRFPYVYIRCVSTMFCGMDDEEREFKACEIMGLPIAEVRKTSADCLFTLQWMTPKEHEDQPAQDRGEHWLGALMERPRTTLEENAVPRVKTAHFFGYKGGQGRSTVLACLAQKLALDGARVLILDADIEAPSLDVIFGVRPDRPGSTLLGIVRGAGPITAVPVLQGRGGGEAGLIACRPRGGGQDIEFAAFALQTSLLPGILSKGATRIRDWAVGQSYDVILVDHRSGMAVTTLTWLKQLPGPTALFVKMDEQWRGAEGVLRRVLGGNPDNPGLIVSLKPDEETEDSFRRRTAKQRENLLEILGQAIASAAQPGLEEEEIDPADIEDHWVLWPYDQAFRTQTLPDHASLGANTRSVLDELARLLDIQIPVKREPERTLSKSGSSDEGDLIRTDALVKLRQKGNTIRYILGRKGTGKTRLATELAREGLGEALLVDANTKLTQGMTTAETEFTSALEKFRTDPEALWWAVLTAALQGEDTERAAMRERLRALLSRENASAGNMKELALGALQGERQRILLMDGIETAFPVSDVSSFVEALFRFLLALQSDDRFSSVLDVKLFLRTDLARMAVQNLEQQIESRDIYLFWDYKKILNFLLSRMPSNNFIKEYFPDTIVKIQTLMETIREGEVSVDEAQDIIANIFPNKLSRSNILTNTFLRIHFADSSSEGPSYYPRVMDSFLDSLNKAYEKNKDGLVSGGKIDQKVIIEAHEKASAEYMGQVRQELQYLLDFGQDSQELQKEKLNKWISAFENRSTPFSVNDMETYLSKEVDIPKDTARKCLEQMLSVGIFERTKDSPALWRAGRLFKFALKMRYKR